MKNVLISLVVVTVAILGPFALFNTSAVYAQDSDDPRVVEDGGRVLGLVPCKDECDFNDLITLANNVIDYMIIVAGLIAVVMFVYAGWLYISSQGDTGKVSKAHGIFKRTAIGFIVVLIAWLIVDNILSALLTGEGFWSILG